MLFAERSQTPHLMPQTVRILDLRFCIRTAFILILADIQLIFIRFRKSAVFTAVPLHGRSGSSPVIAAFHADKILQIMHPDLVSVVNKRHSGHGKEESKRYFQFLFIQLPGNSLHIVIAGRNTDQPFPLRQAVIFHIGRNKFGYIPLSPSGKEGFLYPEQIQIMGRSEMQQKVHVKTALQRLVRFSPLGHKNSRRIFLIQKGAEILPEFYRLRTVRIIFYQRSRHIHPETVAAKRKPETHHLFHRFPGSYRRLGIRRQLPVCGRIGKTIVQSGLGRKEIHGTAAVSRRYSPQASRNTAHIFKIAPYIRIPDIPVRKLIPTGFHGFSKPVVFYGGMAGNQIQKNMHPPPVYLFA